METFRNHRSTALYSTWSLLAAVTPPGGAVAPGPHNGNCLYTSFVVHYSKAERGRKSSLQLLNTNWIVTQGGRGLEGAVWPGLERNIHDINGKNRWLTRALQRRGKGNGTNITGFNLLIGRQKKNKNQLLEKSRTAAGRPTWCRVSDGEVTWSAEIQSELQNQAGSEVKGRLQ